MVGKDFLLLDGGMGLELRRMGLASRTLWAAAALFEAPDAVVSVHRAFTEAGADVITTNNFGATPHTLAMEGKAERLTDYLDRAVDLALRARRESGRPVRIAGCLPPLVESYRPDLVADEATMAATYGHMAARLARGVDLILCETMSSAAEARAAARQAAATGKEVWVAWSLGEDGRLRSGETLEAAHAALNRIPVSGYLVNCCTAELVTAALRCLRPLTDRRIGAYPNGMQPLPADFSIATAAPHPLRRDLTVADYLELAVAWRAEGADIIGGCCGIGPAYIAALHARFDRD